MQRIHAPVPMSAHLALAPPIQEKP
jgi:hypothetical protein